MNNSTNSTKVSGIRVADIIILLLGASLLFFVGWHWNNPLAAWFAPLFLIRFFRCQDKWTMTLIALPIMFIPLWLAVRGNWPLPLKIELINVLTRMLPFVFALYVDRFLARRLNGAIRLLVYPCAFVIGDFILAHGPTGSVFSPAATQFSNKPLIQLVSITGIWGITFLMAWFASLGNAIWERGFDLKSTLRPIIVFSCVLALVIFAGSVRNTKFRPEDDTVRIGSVALEFESPYWAEIKKANPREGKVRNAPGFAVLIDKLFTRSEGAIAQGARIIFWAEANAPMYEDDEEAFLNRATDFARQHKIYFLPGMLVLHYDQVYAQNKVVMIGPEGEILFSYEKAKTPKKTNSDGILHFAETPYGRISAAICFDMDFPGFASQLGDQGIDIMLVPSWDMVGIKPYHTEVGALRALENGFSSVRQAVKGSSMAIDYQGNVLAYQDYFTVDNATMISDVPTKGVKTVYGYLGDWLVYLCVLGLLASFVMAFRNRK